MFFRPVPGRCRIRLFLEAAVRRRAAVQPSLLAFAIVQFISSDRFTSGHARLWLRVSAASVFAGMLLVLAYSLGEFAGTTWLSIPQMARLHGPLNGGFVLLALLGWTLELRTERAFAEKLRSSSFAGVRLSARRAG